MPKSYNSYLKLREPNYCFYPLHLDPYGGGCSHNCAYCFQKDQLCFRNKKDEKTKTRKPTAWDPDSPGISPIEKIQKDFEKVFEQGFPLDYKQVKDHIRSKEYNKKLVRLFCIKNKLPLRIGGVTDPFQKSELEHKVTLGILHLLDKYNYPTQIVTKSNLIATNEYLDILTRKPQNYYVQFTITTLNHKLSKLPGTGMKPWSEPGTVSGGYIWRSRRLSTCCTCRCAPIPRPF